VDLNAYLSILRRRWLPVALSLVVFLVGAVTLTATTERTYRASTRLFLNLPAATGVQEALQGVQLSSQLLESYAEIATSRTAAEAIATEVGGDVTPAQVRRELTAGTQPDTLLIDIVVRSADRDQATAIADAAARTLVAKVAELDAGVERGVEARVIDPAVAGESPVSPRPLRNLVAGLLLGALAGVVLAFLLEALLRPTVDATGTAGVGAPEGRDEPVVAMTSLEARLAEQSALLQTLTLELGRLHERLDRPEAAAPAPAKRTSRQRRNPPAG
jgi:polysaccharide biosynthesis transport protein